MYFKRYAIKNIFFLVVFETEYKEEELSNRNVFSKRYSSFWGGEINLQSREV